MSYYLFLDDSRQPHQVTWVDLPANVAWVKARSYEDFVYVIGQMGIPKFISYDCDLAQEHYDAYFKYREEYIQQSRGFSAKCGIHCVKYLLEVCRKAGVKHPPCIIHTQNNYARPFMEMMVTSYNLGVQLPASSPPSPDANHWDKQSQVPDYAVHSDVLISGFFGPYRWLSNFWPAPVEWKSVRFPSVEVAYQAAKCVSPDDMGKFAGLTAAQAKKLGRTIPTFPDWDSRRLEVMKCLVMQKFGDEVLRAQLIATGDKTLIEANAWKDTFWGVYWKFDAGSRVWNCVGGRNELGGILMDTRKLLK